MRNDIAQARRFEWKYLVSPSDVARLLAAIRDRTRPDPFCEGAPGGSYRVRSVYFDTPDLRFFHETLDGLKVRKKLRLRSYGTPGPDTICFLEIKRKRDQAVFKERAWIPLASVPGALDGVDPAVVMAGRPDGDRRTLERFRLSLHSLQLVPTAVVIYDRQAFVGLEDTSLRVTFDTNLRSLPCPPEDDLFSDRESRPFEGGVVAELKYGGVAPRWLLQLVAQFRMRRGPYSKYCRALRAWYPAPRRIADLQVLETSSRSA